jgi:aspartate racemase
MKKTIGVLGGMGPEASLYFYNLIIKKTSIQTDQDHIQVIINSLPQVPPRTDAILKTGPSPIPMLVEGIQALNRAGVDFIVIPCITAHYFIPEVKQQVDFKFLSLLEESLAWTQRNIPALKYAGLIASTGTLTSKIFHTIYGRAGIDIISPTPELQEKMTTAVFGRQGIKAGYTSDENKKAILEITNTLIQRGAEAIIAGCTEVPLVLKDEDLPIPLIEPMQITAEASILKAGYKLKQREV